MDGSLPTVQLAAPGPATQPAERSGGVTPDADAKTRFVLVDAVGVTEHDFVEPPLNRVRGISLEKIVGVENDPLGLTAGTVYVAITLHRNYEEYAAVNSPFNTGERTIYIKAALLGTAASSIVTIRLGESFQNEMNALIFGRVAGVVSTQGLVGLFSWRTLAGALELFPDGALKVFDEEDMRMPFAVLFGEP